MVLLLINMEDRMRRVLLITMLLATAGMITACRSITPSAGITVDTYPETSITVNSKIVGKYLEVLEYNARSLPGSDILQGQITVQNKSKDDIQMEYRFKWLDGDGMVVDTGMSIWKQVSISAKEKKSLKATAPNKKVEDFEVMVRFLRGRDRWH
jgi:uncharacterized protein YcfL